MLHLPVDDILPELCEALQTRSNALVCAPPGSGKTTQLPKICMELGRGLKGLIGHTQPRRLAARTVANRIAEERAMKNFHLTSQSAETHRWVLVCD